MLETSEQRIRLLKSGFTGSQVEALYFILNGLESVKVDWDDAATKRTRRICSKSSFMNPYPNFDSVRVQVAPSRRLQPVIIPFNTSRIFREAVLKQAGGIA